MNFYKSSYNKMMKFVILNIYLLTLILCCGCMRDPFGRYPDSVQDASVYTKDVYYLGHNFEQQVVFEDIARIEATEVWQAFVGDQLNMVITGHVLLEDENFDDFHIELVSPSLANEVYEFREVNPAQDDSKKKQYVFRWNPSSSFLGEDLRRVINLRFRLTIVGKVNVSVFDNFPVFVYKKPNSTEPILVSIEKPSSVFSGETCKIKITVIDRTSSKGSPPVIDFLDVDDEYDADLITFSKKTQIDNYQWEFEYDFIAPSLERDYTTYHFEVLAMSRFGVSSPVRRSQLTIIRNMENLPQVLGPKEITVSTSNVSHFGLEVQDPLNSGSLEVDRVFSLNSSDIGSIGAFVQKRGDIFNISLRWNVPANTEEVNISGEYELLVNMIYRWNHNGRVFTKRISHTIKANIISIEDVEHPGNFQDVLIEEVL